MVKQILLKVPFAQIFKKHVSGLFFKHNNYKYIQAEYNESADIIEVVNNIIILFDNFITHYIDIVNDMTFNIQIINICDPIDKHDANINIYTKCMFDAKEAKNTRLAAIFEHMIMIVHTKHVYDRNLLCLAASNNITNLVSQLHTILPELYPKDILLACLLNIHQDYDCHKSIHFAEYMWKNFPNKLHQYDQELCHKLMKNGNYTSFRWLWDKYKTQSCVKLFDNFKLACICNSTRIAKWLYERMEYRITARFNVSVRVETNFNIHADNERLFIKMCENNSLETIEWLVSVSTIHLGIIDMFTNDNEAMSIACKKGYDKLYAYLAHRAINLNHYVDFEKHLIHAVNYGILGIIQTIMFVTKGGIGIDMRKDNNYIFNLACYNSKRNNNGYNIVEWLIAATSVNGKCTLDLEADHCYVYKLACHDNNPRLFDILWKTHQIDLLFDSGILSRVAKDDMIQYIANLESQTYSTKKTLPENVVNVKYVVMPKKDEPSIHIDPNAWFECDDIVLPMDDNELFDLTVLDMNNYV